MHSCWSLLGDVDDGPVNARAQVSLSAFSSEGVSHGMNVGNLHPPECFNSWLIMDK